LATRILVDKPSLISTMHGMPEEYGRRYSFKSKAIQRLNFILLSKFFDQTLTVSENIKSSLIFKYGFSHKSVSVVHNGIRLPKNLNKSSQKHFVIGTCGRLQPVKNFKLFIEIAAKISRINTNVHFILAGDGPEKIELKRLCSIFKIDKIVSLPGHVDNMENFYKNIDLFVNTSWHEGIPMSILEAMGYGIPVIAPNVGGISEIIDDGVDGILISHHDTDKFVSACIDLVSNHVKREVMSQAAKEKIKNDFSIDKMADGYCNIYRNTLANYTLIRNR